MSADQPLDTAAPHTLPPLTFDYALNKMAGYLELAADQTDIARMERVNGIADSWGQVAFLINQRSGE